MSIYLMQHIEPIAKGETQLCLEGRRVSSYTPDHEGLPFVNDAALRISLEYKRAFDDQRASLDGPVAMNSVASTPVVEPLRETSSETAPALRRETAIDVVRRRMSDPTVVLDVPTENVTTHRRTCIVCGATFRSKRQDALYHSPAWPNQGQPPSGYNGVSCNR